MLRDQEKPAPKWVGYLKGALVVCVVAAVVAVFIFVDVGTAFKDVLSWIDGLGGRYTHAPRHVQHASMHACALTVGGPFFIALVYIIVTTFFITTAIVSAGCGFLYGAGIGWIVAWIGFNIVSNPPPPFRALR